jgi:1-acyl-sn-glycerol-3-phosphate acyltransferase
LLNHATHLTRNVLHGGGGMTAALAYSNFMPRRHGQPRRALVSQSWFQRWMSRQIALLNIELRVSGAPLIEQGLCVANHISWLDIPVLMQMRRFAFIAKSEVRDWPLVGRFARSMGTLFIERHNRFSVYRKLPQIEQVLRAGQPVMLFPEGTTSLGDRILPFHPMIFETAVRTSLPVQSITLRYLDSAGQPLPSVSFVDEDSFFEALWRTLNERRIIADLHASPAIPSRDSTRKHLARQCRDQMQGRLSVLQSVHQSG